MKQYLLLVGLIGVILLVAGCVSEAKSKGKSSDSSFSPSIREALSTANFELCKEIKDNITRNDCYFYTILLNNYNDRCNQLENGYYRDICTILFVDKASICNNTETKDKYAYFCEWEDAESLNLNLQYQLFKSELRVRKADDCAGMKSGRVKDLCYLKFVDIKHLQEWDEAVNNNNFYYVLPAETISLKENIADQRIKDLFIKKVAELSKHPEYCGQISDSELRAKCKTK